MKHNATIANAAQIRRPSALRRRVRENGLSIALFSLFLVFLVGESIVGQLKYNEEQVTHGKPPVSYLQFISSGSFIEATMENWESEFLQMFAYVLMTAFLYQKGSAESKRLDSPEDVDRVPRLSQDKADAPWPVRKGGLVLKLYQNSLATAFFALFAISFVLHAIGGLWDYNEQQETHSGAMLSLIEYLGSSQFWFESLQNWQSEFLAIAAMVVLSIFLRQKGSPESKPVDAPHSDTGR
jgi:hypothetical protein